VIIIDGYDKKLIYFTFSKCYHHLHLVIEFEIGCEIQVVDEYYYLNIFEHLTNTSKLVKQLVNKKLLMFGCYQVDPDKIKCPFQ
jgi:hypothetical protein